MSSLAALQPNALRRQAGDYEFQRGADWLRFHEFKLHQSTKYEAQGRIDDLDITLQLDDGFLEHNCPCEFAKKGRLCRHVVAVGLAWLRDLTPKARAKAKPTINDAVKLLLETPPDELRDQLLKWASEQPLLREAILLHATHQQGSASSMDLLRDQLKAAIKTRLTKLNARDWKAYTARVEAILARLEALLQEGQPGAAVILTTEAIPLLCQQLERVRDHRHWFAPVERLHALRIAALRQMPLQPKILAKQLFEEEFTSRLDVQHNLLDRYSDFVDPPFALAYRDVLLEAIAALPTPVSGIYQDFDRIIAHRRLTRLASTLKNLSGITEPLLALNPAAPSPAPPQPR
jgi:hypothetical protein